MLEPKAVVSTQCTAPHREGRCYEQPQTITDGQTVTSIVCCPADICWSRAPPLVQRRNDLLVQKPGLAKASRATNDHVQVLIRIPKLAPYPSWHSVHLRDGVHTKAGC